MRKLENLRDTLCEELEKVAKKESINTEDLEIIDKLAHAIKNLDKIIHEDSYDGGGYYFGSYDRGSYDSYGRDSYARRGRDGDGDGRYNEGRSNARGYSREDRSYNMSMDHMRDKLDRMMSEASNDKERETLRRVMNQMDMM